MKHYPATEYSFSPDISSGGGKVKKKKSSEPGTSYGPVRPRYGHGTPKKVQHITRAKKK